MKSSYLTNLILICIVASLFLFSRHSSTPDIDTNSFELIDVKAINDIQLKRAHRDGIKLIRKGDRWQIIQPVNAAANRVRASLLLSILDSPSHNQLAQPSEKVLKQLGLKPIKLSLKLNEHLFVFGDIEPLNKHRYVLYKNTVYLMDDNIAPLLNATAASFINNRLIANNHQITSIQLPLLDDTQLSTTQTISIERNNDHWQSQPQFDSTERLATLIEFWQQAEAMQVTPLTDEDTVNLANMIITVSSKEPATQMTFGLQLTDRNLFIIDHNKMLKYQFPNAMAHQLFLNKKDLY
jgi:hypothetical protein